MDDLYGVPIGKIDKKTAWIVLFFILVIVPIVLFSFAAIFKHGSLKEGWRDFSQQLSGTNDFSKLVYDPSSSDSALHHPCTQSDEDGKIIISNIEWKEPEVKDRTTFTLESPVNSYIQLDCKNFSIQESGKNEPINIEFKTFFTIKRSAFTSDLVFRMEYLDTSGKIVLEREVGGMPGLMTYSKGSLIPVSLYISAGRPIDRIPNKLVLTIVSSNSDNPSLGYVNIQPIESIYRNDWFKLSSKVNALNRFNDSGIEFREVSSKKGIMEFTNSEALSVSGSRNQRYKTSYSHLIYTEWEFKNIDTSQITRLTLEIEFLDESGNVVMVNNTKNLWFKEHGLTLAPLSVWGYGREWAFPDRKTWEQVVSYRLSSIRMGRE